jgi:RNA polymerase sigma-70 factor (ECF subfamily)
MHLRDHRDEIAWQDFLESYAPAVRAYFRRSVRQEADADDLTQETFRKVAAAIDRFQYHPAIGSFQGWVFRIARNVLRDQWRKRQLVRPSGGADANRQLEAVPDDEDETARREEREHAATVVHGALKAVRGEFEEDEWSAFWATRIAGRHAQAVADELDMSLIAVYRAQWRVLGALRGHLTKERQMQ